MTEEEALERLTDMVAADEDPTLSPEQLTRVLAAARRVDRARNSPLNLDTADDWAAATAYPPGAVVQAGNRWWRASVPGISGAAQPSWPNLAGILKSDVIVWDGSVIWIDSGTEWLPTWDLEAAAGAGWRLKAAKAAGRFDYTDEGQSFSRSQVVRACIAMAEQHEARASTVLDVRMIADSMVGGFTDWIELRREGATRP